MVKFFRMPILSSHSITSEINAACLQILPMAKRSCSTASTRNFVSEFHRRRLTQIRLRAKSNRNWGLNFSSLFSSYVHWNVLNSGVLFRVWHVITSSFCRWCTGSASASMVRINYLNFSRKMIAPKKTDRFRIRQFFRFFFPA